MPVSEVNEDIKALVDKMFEMMIESNGIGLAAPQANISLRLFIISLESKREDLMVFINPTLKLSGPTEEMEEGCLSVPGIHAKINRPTRVRVTATNLEGEKFTIDADGLLAKCIQHEFDHIEGKTIADRMSKMSRLRYRAQLQKLKAELEEENA